jgi:mannose-6-phosphate isomerase
MDGCCRYSDNDYDRIDKYGNKRPLHIEQAIAVAETKPARNYKRIGNILAECEYFTVEELVVDGSVQFEVTDNSFISLIVIDGQGELLEDGHITQFTKGDSIFIPAQNNVFKVQGQCRLIMTYL